MKTLVTTLLLAFALNAQTPTAVEILGKARNVTGAGAIKSLSITGERRMTVEAGGVARMVSREVRMDLLLPDKFLRAERLDLPGGVEGPTLVEALDGDAAWREIKGADVHGAPSKIDPNEARATFLRYALVFTLTAPQGSGITFGMTGEDGGAWIVNAKGPKQFALKMFFDQKSGLLDRAEWTGGVLRLSDYGRFSGVLLPRGLNLSVSGKPPEDFEIKSARINPGLRQDQFRK